jgi:hypothetical protein
MFKNMLRNRVFYSPDESGGGGSSNNKNISMSEEQLKNMISDVAKSVAKEVTVNFTKAVGDIKESLGKSVSSSIKDSLGDVSSSLKSFNEIINESLELDDDDDLTDLDNTLDDEDDDISIDSDDEDVVFLADQLGEVKKDVGKKIKELESTSDVKIKDLQKQLDSERSEKEAIRQKGILEKKRAEITSVLDKVGVSTIEGGLKWYTDQVEYDVEQDRFFMKSRDGEVISLEEGIKNTVPDWLKSSKGRSGAGSGQGDGDSTPLDITKKIEDMSKEVETLRQTAASSGQDQDIIAFNSKHKELARLQKEQTKMQTT